MLNVTRSGGIARFRAQFRAGKPSRVARLWAEIKGFWTAEGLTEAGRQWISPGGLTRRSDKRRRAAVARKAGSTDTGSEVRVRLRMAGLPADVRSTGRRVDQGSAHERERPSARLPKAGAGAPAGLQDADRHRVNGSGRGGVGARGEPSAAVWREIRKVNAERMRAWM